MKILEINEERGKTIVSLFNGTKVILDDQQVKDINEIIISALRNSLEEIETKECNSENIPTIPKKESHGKCVSKERRVIFKEISKVINELKNSELITHIVNKFPHLSRKNVSSIVSDWKLGVGMRNYSSELRKYLYSHDYKIGEELYPEIKEKFGISSQDVKREVFLVLDNYFI